MERKNLRVVLDTNVWLDWIHFDDPSISALRAAHRASTIALISNSACLDELARVLAYERFALGPSSQADYLGQVRQCVVIDAGSRTGPAVALPRCTDPDDQKFLELARDAKADWLVTKDRALLTLTRKKFRLAAFRIGTPAQFTATLQMMQ
jgi:putative PIN family toxin of toxin-antitoxin system